MSEASLRGKVAVIGIGQSPVGRVPGRSPLWLAADAARKAIADAGPAVVGAAEQGEGGSLDEKLPGSLAQHLPGLGPFSAPCRHGSFRRQAGRAEVAPVLRVPRHRPGSPAHDVAVPLLHHLADDPVEPELLEPAPGCPGWVHVCE